MNKKQQPSVSIIEFVTLLYMAACGIDITRLEKTTREVTVPRPQPGRTRPAPTVGSDKHAVAPVRQLGNGKRRHSGSSTGNR